MRRRELLEGGSAAFACACVGMGQLTGCAAVTGVSSTPTASPDSLRRTDGAVELRRSKAPGLERVGASLKFELEKADGESIKVLVIHDGPDSFQAYANCCTHMGRELEYDHARTELRCVSFGHSRFDLSGKVLEGPAEEPLRALTIAAQPDRLLIYVG